MSITSKFTNFINNAKQGISEKLSNTWQGAKEITGKVWDNVKDSAVKVGNFVSENAEPIAAALGSAGTGVANYYLGPQAGKFINDSVGGFANMLPEGKVKNVLLAAAGQKRKPPEPAKVDLNNTSPQSTAYTKTLDAANSQSTSVFQNKSNKYPVFVQDVSTAVAPPSTPLSATKTPKRPKITHIVDYVHQKSGRGKVKFASRKDRMKAKAKAASKAKSLTKS